MTYVPTNWVTGDVITAEKLNNMETGISGGSDLFEIPVTLTLDEQSGEYTATTTKTYAEIQTAIEAKKLIYFSYDPFAEGIPYFAYAYSYYASDEVGICVYATNHMIRNDGASLVSNSFELESGEAGEFSITFTIYNTTLTPAT